MRISVFGLGYVGCVTATCLAGRDHQVIGVDVNPFKVERINRGEVPFVEKGLDRLIRRGRKTGRLAATGDASEAILASDLSLICVGTPSLPNHDIDLSHVSRVAEDIGQALRGKPDYHLVVLRSTVLPGTTLELVVPRLEQSSGKRLGRDFGVCYNPEFLREGSSLHDFHHPPKTVIGELRHQDGEVLCSMYRHIRAPLIRTEIPVAEMVKYTDNTFHALKVTFANEIGRICKAHGLDSHRVMEIFCQDKKLNLSRAYLQPGFAFGGSCLPKDLRALLYRCSRKDLEVPLLQAVLASNRLQIQAAVERILQSGRKRLFFLGLSFKAETDDLRESPLVEMIENLLGKGCEIRIYDRNVSLARMHGTNREYMEKHLPHLATLLTSDLEESLRHAELIVLGNRSDVSPEVLRLAGPDQIILDLVRVTANPETRADYDGLSW